jgi:outer membrane protein OmpA-like peptidoglycan-associated protein
MKRTRVSFVLFIGFYFASSMLVYGQDNISIDGLITQRAADGLTVRTSEGDKNIVLTDATKVQPPKGLRFRRQQMFWTELIPGLNVSIKASQGADGKLTARTISFSKQDLQTASKIQAELSPTEEKVTTNQEAIAVNQANIAANETQIPENEKEVSERFSSLADYDVREQIVVRFATGKSELSPADRMELATMAAEAGKLPDYIIEVKGFADSAGNAATNETLSRDRAYAVVNFLLQECRVPPRQIVAPGAMGISNPVASKETAQGRAANRRVEAKVLVNKAIAADTQ